MFGVPAKCPRCNKTVYAAEQKLAENKSWHAVCWALEFKEREAAKKAHKDATSYVKHNLSSNFLTNFVKFDC